MYGISKTHHKEDASIMKTVASVGILVADVIAGPMNGYPEKGLLQPVNAITLHNGGNAMTAALNLTKLGVKTNMIGKVGDDVYGAFLRDKLEKSGVNTSGLKTDKSAQTSVSVVLLDNSGERSFLHCVGANGTFSEKDIDYSLIESCDLVFVTGTFLMNTFDGTETMEFLKKCKEMGKTTFLDVCWDASGRWGELLNMAMPYIDYFMPSIDEAVCIAECEDVEEIADSFFAKGVKNVVIKMGSKGAFLRRGTDAKGQIFPCCKGVTAVDTTGAGDSFCSGFLAAFARDCELEDCVKFANGTGAHCVMAKGATTGIKSYEEILDFVNKQ